MRILLTGSSGILGSDIVRTLKTKKIEFKELDYRLISNDIKTCRDSLLWCDVIIHAAANTDVEFCEKNPNESFQDNFVISSILCELACKYKVKFVFISSTGVYGDYKKTPYNEYDKPNPLTVYHKHKFEVEKLTISNNPHNLIFRLGWLFGGSICNKKNFIARRIDEAKKSLFTKNKTMYSNVDQYGNPSYSKDISGVIIDLIGLQQSGIFNCVNEGVVSRYDYVSSIIKFANIDIPLEAKSASFFDRVAPVSINESAENLRLKEINYPSIRDWKVGLKEYISANFTN
jgi:dTDP-4-dehydrorhamnose reductase